MTITAASHSTNILGSLSGLAIAVGVASLVIASLVLLFSLRRVRALRLLVVVIVVAIAGSATAYFQADTGLS